MTTPLHDRLHEVANAVPELGDLDRAIATREQRRTATLAATVAVGVACVVALVAVLLAGSPITLNPEPLQSPMPSPTTNSFVHGWLKTSGRNPAGLYSLDYGKCGEPYFYGQCWHLEDGSILGTMHNRYGDVALSISIASTNSQGAAGFGGKAVRAKVAGYDGHYREIDAGHGRWTAEIGDTIVTVDMESVPGTNQAHLAEALAIIASLRTEPDGAPFGYRLVFTLTTNVWTTG